MIKDKSYFIVHGWMINGLKLSKNRLLVFAVVYGFSHDGISSFKGSLKYLQSFTNAGRSTVIRSLESLVNDSMIDKIEHYVNGIKVNEYKYNEIGCNRYIQNGTGGVKMKPPPFQNGTGGGIKMEPNTIINNIDNNIGRSNSDSKESHTEDSKDDKLKLERMKYGMCKSLYKKKVEEYYDRIGINGVEIEWRGKEGKNMKILIEIIEKRIKDDGGDRLKVIKENLGAFMDVVLNMEDSWFRENCLSPSGLVSQFNKIINKYQHERKGINSKKRGNGGGKSFEQLMEEL